MKGIISEIGSHDPYHNIAVETFLFNSHKNDVRLFLWQNEPSVIFGRNQNTAAEADLSYMHANGVHAVRRFTGGGAVYHDLGNLNYTFIVNDPSADPVPWQKIILASLQKIGISASFSGRNDLMAEKRKIGGTAWMMEDDRFLFHGTLLISADFSSMAKILTPSIEKFAGKQIRSVSGRVANLNELIPKITVQQLKDTIIEQFQKQYPCSFETVDDSCKAVCDMEKQLKDRNWIYGENGECSFILHEHMDLETLEIHIYADQGLIERAEVFSDGMAACHHQELENALKGLPADIDAVKMFLHRNKSLFSR